MKYYKLECTNPLGSDAPYIRHFNVQMIENGWSIDKTEDNGIFSITYKREGDRTYSDDIKARQAWMTAMMKDMESGLLSTFSLPDA